MLEKLFKYCIVSFLFLMLLEAKGQREPLITEFTDIKLLPSRDTLILHRKQSKWWFGLSTGLNLNKYFGDLDLKIYPDPNLPDSLSYSIKYKTGYGIGAFGGLLSEWSPVDQDWGIGAMLNFYDYKISNAQFQYNVASDTIYKSEGSFTYLTFSPTFRYKLPIFGLTAFTGFDLDLNYNRAMKTFLYFKNTGKIDQISDQSISTKAVRAGLHAGLSYEFLLTDISKSSRIYLTPYIMAQTGTQILNNQGSNWNIASLKIGISVKFSQDEVKTDTIFYDSTIVHPPAYIASVRNEGGPIFEGFQNLSSLSTYLIAYVEAPVILAAADIEEKSEINTSAAPVNVTPQAAPILEKIDPTKKFTFLFSSEKSVNFSDKDKLKLEAIAQFMKENPAYNAQVVGHTESFGSDIAERTKISIDRANRVKAFLESKNIKDTRILATGKGSLLPVSTNATPQGRRQNRRVEIQLVKK
ncbi:MAG: OmpA family protein [Candidatus Kapabacteria bacterium]|nr:OmpA family protein [Candidatus Kapabacteria bacterium]